MKNIPVDLTNCDREPIHIPGQIQAHGFLVVIDEAHIIRYASTNTSQLARAPDSNLLGLSVADLEQRLNVEENTISNFINAGKSSGAFDPANPLELKINETDYYLIVAASSEFYLLEFEPAFSSFNIQVQNRMGRSIAELLKHKDLNDLLNAAARQVKKIIGYDRVMIYRFGDDGHGEVAAEEREAGLPSWLGLHYPASDIPKQARELYKLNLTRLIANVHTETTQILTGPQNSIPLDLTRSQLRAVSPIHIQYLKNMGVASSFSISIICNDELWGLIACHHYTPKFIDYRSREYAKLVGQILSSALQYRGEIADQHRLEASKNSLSKIAKSLQERTNIRQALLHDPAELLALVRATGALVVIGGAIHALGNTPPVQEMEHLVDWLKENIEVSVCNTKMLSAMYPESRAYQGLASGMMVLTISRELGEYIVWFKPEVSQTINWAGQPADKQELQANGMLNISPRQSFEVWSEQVSGSSETWSKQDTLAVNLLRQEIEHAVTLKADAVKLLNESLRLAYEELETFSYTISHDLKSPIASIKGYAQLLARDQSIIERGKEMAQRIADRADQMNLMIGAILDYSRIGKSAMQLLLVPTRPIIDETINDLLLQYADSALEVTVGETPDLKGDRTMLSQVFANLLGNAVKYSQYATPAKVHVAGWRDDGHICYAVKDNGLGIAEKDLPKVFELFHRMDNVKDMEGSGVGLAIVKRIVEKHDGRIWAESEIGQGSTFYFRIKH
ncbi:ATP-binding protein [Mucilaginibacter aquaedulcis]|uniref:ATP-binding protein n=1 Tax=Mucilaginibacter aquaedulcis TaxID=1187081 RepID=UPI0025B54EE6|nr:ATP-binding protein [Mucilaginibacter aquaedulcis]MDN3547837.1 ATP-binding protein [Mucilaginibacter aquaedulcis]